MYNHQFKGNRVLIDEVIHSEDRTEEECCQSSLICEKEDFYRKTTKNVGLQFAHMLNSFFGPPSILYVFVSR